MGTPFLWTGTLTVDALRNTIGDPSGATTTRWTNAELVGYLNRAMLQVVADADTAFETVWTADLVDGTREYKLPDAWHSTAKVRWVKTANTDIRILKRVDFHVYQNWLARDEDATGTPTQYYYWRKLGTDPTTAQPQSIFLDPTPDAGAAGTANLEIWGYKYPDALDSTALTPVVELEPPYVETVLIWASSLVAMDEDDMVKADRLEAKYHRMMDIVTGSLSRRDRSENERLLPKGQGRFELRERTWLPF